MISPLSLNAWRAPQAHVQQVNTEQLKQIIHTHAGEITARGQRWVIRHKPLGPGIHRLFLEPKSWYEKRQTR